MKNLLLTSSDKIIMAIFGVGVLTSLSWPLLFLAKYPQFIGTAIIGTAAGLAITTAICLMLALLVDMRDAARGCSGPDA
jgi:polyferredoxin